MPDLGGERGDGPVGSVIGAGVFLAGLLLVVQLALSHHAAHLLAVAADHGARHGARLDGSTDEAIDASDRFLDRSGRTLLDRWSTVARVESDGLGGRRLVVVITADLTGPLGGRRVVVSTSAPIEAFTPQARRS